MPLCQFHRPRVVPNIPRAGVTLLEVLISMFILLFGLVGVASLFPVGKYHAKQALQYDQAAAIGQRAFEEIRVRGLLQPDRWNLQNGTQFTAAYPSNWQTKAVMFDPLAVAPPNNSNWVPVSSAPANLLQRVTLRGPNGDNILPATADQLCRARDDIRLEIPPTRTTPPIQRITAAEREYNGDYTWAFTAVPAREMGEGYYTVSVVVFRGRQVSGEWFQTNSSGVRNLGESRLRLPGTVQQTRKLKVGEWLLLSVPSRPNDNWYRWYKIVSIGFINTAGLANLQVQGPMVGGTYDPATGPGIVNATVFGSAVAVYEQLMRVDSDSDWKVD